MTEAASYRLPPHNIEAELGVLGSILQDNDVLHDVAFLRVEDFYRNTNQALWRAILDLYERGFVIDGITLADELQRRDQLKLIGGPEGLADIQNCVPHAASARYYAGIVHEKATARLLVECGNEILQTCYSNNFTADQLMDAAEHRVYAINDARRQIDELDAAAAASAGMNLILARQEGRRIGLPCGLVDLDAVTGGFHESNLIVVAARPSIGKTALGCRFLEHVCLDLGRPALFVTLEMGHAEITERLMVSRARVSGSRARLPRGLHTVEIERLGRAHAEWSQAPCVFDPGPVRTVSQIAALARRQRLRRGLAFVMIDYIQLIQPADPRDNRQEQVARISRELKILAGQLRCPIVLLCQLNREVEKRKDRRPELADLRESGAIEQDADVVILIHRPEFYDPNDQPGIAELIVAKNRHGATGLVKSTYIKDQVRFENHLGIISPSADGEPAF